MKIMSRNVVGMIALATSMIFADVVIEDFTSTHQINYAPGVVTEDLGYWYGYADTYGTTATNNIPDGTIITDFTGPVTLTGSLAADNTVDSEYAYSGIGFDLYNSGNVLDASKTTVDVTAHTGITITYTSSKALFLLMSEAMTDDGAGYYCVLAAGTNVTATCLWADFVQPDWSVDAGLTRSLPTANVVGFKFQFKESAGDYSLSISNVSFAGGEVTIDPSSSSEISSSSSVISSSSSIITDPGSSDLIIEDFASTHQINYAPNVVAADRGYWYEYSDTFGTTATSNIPDGTVETDFTGPLTFSGSLAANDVDAGDYSYTGVGFDLYNSGNVLDASKTTVDVTGHTGITVTYTSSKALFLLMSEAMTDDGAGYYCELAAGTNVTKTCSWSDFEQPNWAADAGLTRSLPTSNLVGFKFQFKDFSGAYSLTINSVAFVGGTRLDDEGTVDPSSSSTTDPSSSSEISSSSSVISSSSSIITDPGSSDLIIEDFASTHQINYAPNVVATDRGYWYEYNDEFGTTATSNIPDGTVETDFTGPLTFSGSLVANDVNAGDYSYTGVGFDLYNSGNILDASKTTVDVTGHTGITVTYTSSKALFLMMSEAMTDDGAGYYCALAAGDNVTKTCLWSDFLQPNWADGAGLTRSLPTSNLVGFKFQFKDFSGAYSLTINSVAFVGGIRLDDEGTVDPSSSSTTTDPSSSSTTTDPSSSSVTTDPSSSSVTTDPGVDAVLNVAQNLGLVITNSNIRLDMKNSSFVNVELYNVSGNKVANVFKGISNGNIDWNNANIAEGVYIFKIQALGYSFAKKFVLTK